MHNTDDGGPISIMHEDVGTVLGVQAVVKSMLDDVIGGQQIQKQQLSDILHSGTLPSNRTSVSPPTSPRTSTPRRDMDMAMLENLVEELQRHTSHQTTSVPSNTSDPLTSTPQTTQTPRPRGRPRPPNRFFSQMEGVWFARRAEGCSN